MIVLLVYGKAVEPAALILHGNNSQTWISVAESGLARDDHDLITSIRVILASLLAAER
jgi:hypothetical protein